MVAAPFKGTLTLVGLTSGKTEQIAFSATDVANAFITMDKTGLSFWQNANEQVAVTDIQLSAAGTDTTALDLIVNGADTNVRYRNNAVLDSRQYPRITRSQPIAAAATIQFKQIT